MWKKSCEYFKFVFEAQLYARYVKITAIQISHKIKTDIIYFNR
jgi:hypothetical protein